MSQQRQARLRQIAAIGLGVGVAMALMAGANELASERASSAGPGRRRRG